MTSDAAAQHFDFDAATADWRSDGDLILRQVWDVVLSGVTLEFTAFADTASECP